MSKDRRNLQLNLTITEDITERRIHLNFTNSVNHVNTEEQITFHFDGDDREDDKLFKVLAQRLNPHVVVSLNLTSCVLRDFPSAFSELENLEELNLSKNQITVVPKCLENNLYYIKKLDLSHNSITKFDRIPKCYRKLQILKINNNNLIGIPKWILQVESPSLEEFDYSCNIVNSFKDSRFHLCSNYKLKKLKLSNCKVWEEDLFYIKSIETLEELDLSNNYKTEHYNTFSNCDKLFENPVWVNNIQVLNLSKLSISFLSEDISFMRNLRVLELTSNKLSWLPEYLPYLENLEVLDVSHNNIISLPKEFGYLCNLKVLKIQNNHLGSIPDLNYLKKLTYLDCYNNELDDFAYNIQHFEYIDLEQNYLETYKLENYSLYETKKLHLRNALNFDRLDGRRIEKAYDSDNSSSVTTEDYEDGCTVETEYTEEESWDVPKRPENYVSQCSPSDDEWTGCVSFPKTVTRPRSKEKIPVEDVIYADAD